MYTLQIGLRQFEAASLVVMPPVLAIFLIFQQYFIEGISISGMGGR